ncbi:MAG: UrcA family protein [Novosphingobium sp.]
MFRPFAAAAAFATLATLGSTAPVFARDIAVQYSDLDLGTAAGRERFETRIAAAARRVCADRSGPRSLKESAAIADCVRAARDSARTRMAAALAQTPSGG